jgi:hypothetical protein
VTLVHRKSDIAIDRDAKEPPGQPVYRENPQAAATSNALTLIRNECEEHERSRRLASENRSDRRAPK